MVRKPLFAAAALAAALATALAMLTGGAAAQLPMPSLNLHRDKTPPTSAEIEKQKALDRAYKAATKKIPDRNRASDPWSDVRTMPAPAR